MTQKLARQVVELGLSVIIASHVGCSHSSNISELSDASKKSLVKRKVDVQARTTKSTHASPGAPNPDNSKQRP
jgi:uncharacterized lipoprotein NlpE involved in copper resistance